MSEPTKKWNETCDDRTAIARAAGVGREATDLVLDALFAHVFSNVKTVIVGHATFEWTPTMGKTPYGGDYVTRRLRVMPSRYADKPAKDVPVTGEMPDEREIENDDQD